MFQALPPVFAGIQGSDSHEAAKLLQEIEVPNGEAIMMEGESDQTIAFILKGSVQVWMGETLVGSAGARELIGEMELYYPMTRVCSVTASHDTVLQLFTPEAYWQLCEQGNPIVYNIERYAIRRLSDRLQTLNREITERSESGGLLNFDRSEPGLLGRLFGGRKKKADIHALDVLRKSEMFDWAEQSLVEALTEHFEVVAFDKDHVICEQGEDGDKMWIIGAGEVDITLVTDEDDETGETIGRLGPGHAFGDSSIVMNADRTATCVARSDVQLLELDRANYLELHGVDDVIGSTFRQGMIRNLVVQLLATTRRYVALQPSLASKDRLQPGSEVWR